MRWRSGLKEIGISLFYFVSQLIHILHQRCSTDIFPRVLSIYLFISLSTKEKWWWELTIHSIQRNIVDARVIPDVDCANCVPLLKECNVFWYAILQVRLQILESSIRVNTVWIFHANAFLPCQLFFLVDVIISGFWIIINYRPFDLGKFGMLASEAYCAWLMWLNIVPDEFCNMWSIRTLDDEFYQNS